MADFSDSDIVHLSVHRVGNKSREEGFQVSAKPIDQDDNGALTEILLKYFLGAFKGSEYYHFTHHSDLELNEMYNFARSIFANPDGMHLQSISMLKHLYDASDHPKIKAGELYVVYFTGTRLDAEQIKAIGIFKSESKDSFLRLKEAQDNTIDLEFEWGISAKNIDKGCMIFDVEQEEGYRLMIVDSANAETRFWSEDFLNIERVKDNAYQTENFLTLCRNFVDEVYAEKTDRKEQIMFLNKSVEYFDSHDVFDRDSFANDVIGDQEEVERFYTYKSNYEQEMGVEIVEDFGISKSGIKTVKKKIRNLIKLDTGMEIRLTGQDLSRIQNFMEHEYDEEKGMYYYKLYFNRES